MAFTNEDLEQMKNECVAELKALGYEVLPIAEISFSRRLSACYGICRTHKDCRRNNETRKFENPAVVILLEWPISCLPKKWREQIKILVMHECIHAVKSKLFPRKLTTKHGPDYDEIVSAVEKKYGYLGINDNDHHHFEDVLPAIRMQLQKEKERH